MLIINAELAGSRGNVRLGEKIQEVSTALTARPGEFVLDAKGGALLPGLHDHHMHFLASAAYEESINCDDEEFEDVDEWLSEQGFTEKESMYYIEDGVTVELMTGDAELDPIV